jgi:PAS domain S-box-containing protein
VRGEDLPSRSELKVITKDGQTRYVDFAATRTEFEGESAILGTAFDITATKRHEQQAQERTAFLQTLLENSPFGILVGGQDHLVRFCNPAFERIFGYSGAEVLGKDPDDLIGLPENTEAKDLSRRVLSGQTVQATTVRRRQDGSRVHVDLHAIPLFSGDTFNGCFGIYQDVTERVESAAAVQALRLRLTRVQEEERAYVARELHDDICQRLVVVALQLAEQAAQPATPSEIDRRHASGKLVNEILTDLHRLSHRLHPSMLEHLGLTAALSSLCNECTRRGEIQVDFEHHNIADRLPTDMKTCLYRVVQEAIRNAEQHSGANRVRVTLTTSPGFIHCGVSDSGRGFAARAVDRRRGVGLVSMTERVQSLGGTLSVQSEVGGGTRIEASIPLRLTD